METQLAQTELIGDVPESLLAYMVHFGEKRISPRVLAVEDGLLLKTARINGPKLGSLLEEAFLGEDFKENEPAFREIYSKLGRKVAYVSKFGIVHGDLAPRNIVVENGEPYIIDWETCFLLSLTHQEPRENYKFWMGKNSRELLRDTRYYLYHLGLLKTYKEFARAYSEEFRKELIAPLDITYEEINRGTTELFGVTW